MGERDLDTLRQRELLFSITKDDFIVEVFRGTGHGGQKINKTSSAVRVRHPESGAIAESREHRSQLQNKKAAFLKVVNSEIFESWRKKKSAELMMTARMKEIRERAIRVAVEKSMAPSNLLVEVRTPDGIWIHE